MVKKRVVLLNLPEEKEFVRFEILEKIFRELGWDTITIRNDVWGDHKFRQEIFHKPYLLFVSVLRYLGYVFRLFQTLLFRQYEFIYIAYPAYFDILPTSLIAMMRRKPVVTEFFLSLYDTLLSDRKLLQADNFITRMLYRIEGYLINVSSYVLVDTWENAKRYNAIFHANNMDKFQRVIVGTGLLLDDNLGEVQNNHRLKLLPDDRINVGWVGSYIPLHGIDKILGVIKSFKNDDRFHFILIGDGQEFSKAQEYIKENELDNVSILSRMDFISTMRILKQCDVCLGIFGDSAKANAVIPVKIYDYIALKKIVITKDTPAMHELENVNNLVLVRNDILSISRALESQDHQELDLDLQGCSHIYQLLNDDVLKFLNVVVPDIEVSRSRLEAVTTQKMYY